MRAQILISTAIIFFLLAFISGCAEKELSVKNLNLAESGDKLEITFTAVNLGDEGNCSAYIAINNLNETLSSKTIYFGVMEKGKKIQVRDTISLYPEYTGLDVRGKCE